MSQSVKQLHYSGKEIWRISRKQARSNGTDCGIGPGDLVKQSQYYFISQDAIFDYFNLRSQKECIYLSDDLPTSVMFGNFAVT